MHAHTHTKRTDIYLVHDSLALLSAVEAIKDINIASSSTKQSCSVQIKCAADRCDIWLYSAFLLYASFSSQMSEHKELHYTVDFIHREQSGSVQQSSKHRLLCFSVMAMKIAANKIIDANSTACSKYQATPLFLNRSLEAWQKHGLSYLSALPSSALEATWCFLSTGDTVRLRYRIHYCTDRDLAQRFFSKSY
jgi:hypothetical protein